MTRVYVATPYSDPDPAIVAERVKSVGTFAAWLWRERGMTPFSPINHWHDIAQREALPSHAAAWEEANRTMLQVCQAVYLLRLPGWESSIGVGMELEWAREYRLPVMGADPIGKSYRLEVMR